MKRVKQTTFERLDFQLPPTDPAPRAPAPKPQAPPAAPRPAPTGPMPSMEGEIALPKRLDPHDTGRIDTQFARHQEQAPMVVIVVVGITLALAVFGLLFFVGLALAITQS